MLEPVAKVTVEEVTTTQALEDLRPEWSELWTRCPTATPFQSPAWLIPWWRHLGDGNLWTLALRCQGRLIGLVPQFIHTQPGSSVREVLLIGTGMTDYLDALFEHGLESLSMIALFAHLNTRCRYWDRCDFQQLRPGSPLLEAGLPAGWLDEITEQEPCPVLALPATPEELLERLPYHIPKNLRYYWRRVQEIGPAQIESTRQDNLNEWFDTLVQFHHARWTSRGGKGVLADATVQRVHREALPELLALGMLRFYGLRIGDRLVAAFYGLTDNKSLNKRTYAYLSGFDPAFERLSLGTLVIGHALQEAVREGAETFDFLRGREAYKYLWGAQDNRSYRRRLRHKSAEKFPDESGPALHSI